VLIIHFLDRRLKVGNEKIIEKSTMKFLCIVILSATKSLKEFAEKSIGFEWKVDFLVLGDKIQCNVFM